MTARGSSYAWFRRCLARGDLAGVRAAVAGALRSLSSGPTPRETFAAASTSAEERIARLCRPPYERPGTSGGLVTAVAILATGPIASIAVPILVAASSTR